MSSLTNSLDRLYISGKLTKEKYDYLKELANSVDSSGEITSKEQMIAKLSKECEDRIINGIDFTWDGETHHYSLDITDQMQINVLLTNIKNGATKTSWHHNGGKCEEWTAEKFLAFAEKALTFATYTKTRFNTGIRPLILSMEDIEQIKLITLDTELSVEVETEIANIVRVILTGQ